VSSGGVGSIGEKLNNAREVIKVVISFILYLELVVKKFYCNFLKECLKHIGVPICAKDVPFTQDFRAFLRWGLLLHCNTSLTLFSLIRC